MGLSRMLDRCGFRTSRDTCARGWRRATTFSLPRAIKESSSERDRSTKLALRLRDGRIVECVHLQTPRLHTLCVSSQVGCAMACEFCATGKMGLLRNLEAWEILARS